MSLAAQPNSQLTPDCDSGVNSGPLCPRCGIRPSRPPRKDGRLQSWCKECNTENMREVRKREAPMSKRIFKLEAAFASLHAETRELRRMLQDLIAAR